MSVQLEQILTYIISQKPTTKAAFDDARRHICGELKIEQPPNNVLLKSYQNLVEKKSVARDTLIEQLLRKATVRSQSGIAIVTSLVKPYMCPGKCVYCPTEVRMPKSYIATEPAAARALMLNFSPYDQMKQRILMLEKNGHPTDKIEYIIKGGTWNAYPLKYQYWFILESFRAANEASKQTKQSRQGKQEKQLTENSTLEELQEALEEEQTENESADHRIIGLTLETRPDAISPKTIYHMRRLGCTRIELGLQAPDDKILELIKRGHTVEQFRKAILLLRQAGFKVDLHFMPDLPGTTPEHDVEMYKSLFEDIGLRPDMVKIYPTAVVKSAELYQWLLDGKYTPYGEENLFNALLQMKLATPRYCRISRLIRDIPSDEIEAGNKITNLREVLTKELKKRGERCMCLRCREISRHENIKAPASPAGWLKHESIPQLFIDTYETIGGTEYFLSYEDTDRIAVYGFLRLRIPNLANQENLDNLANFLPEIRDCAFIRELHTYGQMVKIGEQEADAAQHKGLGKQLVAEAEKIAQAHGFKKVAVISGVGVREYYRKLGYRKVGTYMIKSL